jgi:hypothetical protein
VQDAPWNNEDLVDRPRFGAVGSHLLDGAVKLSVDWSTADASVVERYKERAAGWLASQMSHPGALLGKMRFIQ